MFRKLKIIPLKWNFRIKRKTLPDGEVEDVHIANIVSADPVPKSRKYNPAPKVIRLVLAHAMAHDYKACQLHVELKSTELDEPDRPLTFSPPEVAGEQLRVGVARLNRPIPGTKHFERMWYERFTNFFVDKYNFKACDAAKGVWVYAPNNQMKLIVMIGFDDILVFGQTDKHVKWIVSQIESKFKVKNLGLPLLIMDINFRIEDKSVHISLYYMLTSVADKWDIDDDHSVRSPIEPSFDLKWKSTGSKQVLTKKERAKKMEIYQLLMKDLMAIFKWRPDIAEPISKLVHLEPQVNDWLIAAAKRVLQFVCNTYATYYLLEYNPRDAETFKARLFVNKTAIDLHITMSYMISKHGNIDWSVKVLDETDLNRALETNTNVLGNELDNMELIDQFLLTGKNVDDRAVGPSMINAMDPNTEPDYRIILKDIIKTFPWGIDQNT